MIPKSIEQAYRYYNRAYFHNELPSTCKVLFKSRRQFRKYSKQILDGATLSTLDSMKVKHEIWIWKGTRIIFAYALIILLHEMIHLYLGLKGIEHANHGYHFKKEQRRLHLKGAYDNLL